MLASYFLSRTLIPTLVMYIMRGHEHRAEAARSRPGPLPARVRAEVRETSAGATSALLETTLEHRGVFVQRLPGLLRPVPGPVLLPGPGLLPPGGRRPAAAARAGPPGPAGGGDGPALRPGGSRAAGGDPQGPAAAPSWTTSACPIPASTSPTVPAAPSAPADAEILIALDPEHHEPTAELTRAPAGGAAPALPGGGVLLPARRHRHPDPELRPARAHRRAGRSARTWQANYAIAQRIASADAPHPRRRRRARAAAAVPAHPAHGHRPHPGRRRWG